MFGLLNVTKCRNCLAERERDKIAKITLFLLISTTFKRFITSKKRLYTHIEYVRIFQEWIHADIFKTQRYSFLHKDTNKSNRVCDLQMRSRMLSLAVFYRAFFYDAVVSNFVKFHTTTKVYPNDERCESLYIRKITIVRSFAYPARFLRRVVPTPPPPTRVRT